METHKPNLAELAQQDDELTILCAIIDWLRPENVTQIDEVEEKIEDLAQNMAQEPEAAAQIRSKLSKFIVDLRFLPLYSDTGILPRRRFASELRRRVYNKLAPAPPVIFSAKNLIEQVFDQPGDPEWVEALPDEAWMQLYGSLIPSESSDKVKLHLVDEALYALEMLSIWLAAEEMEDELLRLDSTIADFDSNFIAQEREISRFVTACRSRLIPTVASEEIDASHAWVMLEQCSQQVKRFRQLALSKGSDLQLTYLLERLEQIMARIRTLLAILTADNPPEIQTRSLALFRQLVRQQSDEHSVNSLLRQTSYLLAKSVTNQASETGEHYVTKDRREYAEMMKRGLGPASLSRSWR